MTVYIIARFKIHDRAGYDRYEENFFEVFEPFGGTMLSVDEEPTILQGDFDFTRSVLIEFPSAEQAMAWMTSPEYQEIAKHRLCLLYTSPSPRDGLLSRMPSSA